MKCLTYQEFLVELYSTWDHTILRKGQYLMNLLHKHWPEEYARVTALNVEGKQVDCFYNDNLVQNTLEHLSKVWPK